MLLVRSLSTHRLGRPGGSKIVDRRLISEHPTQCCTHYDHEQCSSGTVCSEVSGAQMPDVLGVSITSSLYGLRTAELARGACAHLLLDPQIPRPSLSSLMRSSHGLLQPTISCIARVPLAFMALTWQATILSANQDICSGMAEAEMLYEFPNLCWTPWKGHLHFPQTENA